MGGDLEIRLLGSLEVTDDLGCLVAVRGPRLTTLLTALALRCGEVVTDDRLSEILWGDDPPHGANALQRQISTLRGVLGRADTIERRGRGYVLCVERAAIDVFQFEGLARRGREAMREGDRVSPVPCSTRPSGCGGATHWSTLPTSCSRKPTVPGSPR